MIPIGGVRGSGIWTVPFWLEERRVPKLPGVQQKQIPLAHLDFKDYFKRMKRLGYWPEAIKAQVMVEPKEGESLEGHILESEIPVEWK
ncbi:MAG: hypothetical protein HY400_00085 [Elusimicrobia bacterium]|nr:hypothetical protein [Elusimicrobiota bacterium]